MREARVPISNPEPSPLHQVSALSARGHSHLRKVWHTGDQGLDQLSRVELEHGGRLPGGGDPRAEISGITRDLISEAVGEGDAGRVSCGGVKPCGCARGNDKQIGIIWAGHGVLKSPPGPRKANSGVGLLS